ncbi:hypothetical protein GVN21_04945 [Caulobacter sp. SLTY]|uniref:hypothetical protein n=1 Tax=Caulobacter sp. SLTY TaxID=2683262 RepID=UPI001412E900|nr:hypothetical protein [Caulobacter sp. SLTY]NBB14709.1 hypothetical protein [Caulobacter sp. SLTY]
MTLIDRLPGLTDAEVTNLLSNARRLSEGTDIRKDAAAEMLPALEAEAESRAAARTATLSAARKARAPARRKATDRLVAA